MLRKVAYLFTWRTKKFEAFKQLKLRNLLENKNNCQIVSTDRIEGVIFNRFSHYKSTTI